MENEDKEDEETDKKKRKKWTRIRRENAPKLRNKTKTEESRMEKMRKDEETEDDEEETRGAEPFNFVEWISKDKVIKPSSV